MSLLGQRRTGRMSKLSWKILTKKRASSTQGIPPGKEDLAWVTNTVTLISGEHDAVLVDTFLSESDGNELVDWIAGSGKNLTTIYITHAHADHFYGLKLLLDRFPNVAPLATPSVAALARAHIVPGYVRAVWEPRFPGQLPRSLAAPNALDGDTFTLEGEVLRVLEFGHTDTEHTTGLHVPSIGLVVSGDVVYSNTHLYLAEYSDDAGRDWLRALDSIEALRPQAVIAGHGELHPDSSPRHIDETRRYLRAFVAAKAKTSTAIELYQTMLSLYPNRVNPGALWAAANGQALVASPHAHCRLRRLSRIYCNGDSMRRHHEGGTAAERRPRQPTT
jgi:glyoxylase-like metal-dependent hydrolase (beta-lactamase superfamily II)